MKTKLKGPWVTHVGNKKLNNEDSVFFGKANVSGRSMGISRHAWQRFRVVRGRGDPFRAACVSAAKR
jgi:hypothetical protein